MRGEQLEAAIVEDRAQGLIPFFIVATLGTTPTVNINYKKKRKRSSHYFL
jgi:glutamate/tyrosine decarboxylase-like PLP-dependent enzyme